MEKSPELMAIICFYNVARGMQSVLAFSNQYRHCSVMVYDGDGDYWIGVEFVLSGIKVKLIKTKSANRLMECLKRLSCVESFVCLEVNERKKQMWLPLWGRTCNEVCRYTSGVDVGLTFNPIHLYKKLLKYSGKRNYEILAHWKR